MAILKYYKVDSDGKIKRLRRECPTAECGAGIFVSIYPSTLQYLAYWSTTIRWPSTRIASTAANAAWLTRLLLVPSLRQFKGDVCRRLCTLGFTTLCYALIHANDSLAPCYPCCQYPLPALIWYIIAIIDNWNAFYRIAVNFWWHSHWTQ